MRGALAEQERPIVTLVTDFGYVDPFVGIMKGVILSIAPEAAIVDLSHDVPAHNVLAGAYFLRAAFPHFPKHTVHVAVVDPGVGTHRKPIVISTRHGMFVGPDNGLLLPAATEAGILATFWVRRRELLPGRVSPTFHGRDVFAPVAARLAMGFPVERCGPLLSAPLPLPEPAVKRIPGGLRGEVVWVDRFGNLITNIRREEILRLRPATVRATGRGFYGRWLSVTIGSFVIDGLSATYGLGARGELLALVNSAGLLEIAARQSSAREGTGLGPGAPVMVKVVNRRR